jgi:DNA-directed RNA polymerase specialized sigma subunit
MVVDPDSALIEAARKGDFAAKNTLLAKYQPTIGWIIRRWSRTPVPASAIQGEAMKLFLQAIDRYDPKEGVLFKTFMETQLRGLNRYVNSNKNVARVPEHRMFQIRRYQNAKSLLTAQKDREPTEDEMSDHLGWSQQQTRMMDTALSRGALALSESEERGFTDPATSYSRFGETFDFLYWQMSPEEKLIYDRSLGAHGKKKIESVAEMAKVTGVPADKIYAIKRKLAKDVMRAV